MNVLVTGGTGFLGGFLLKRLTDDGHKVVALVRKSSDLKNIDGKSVKLVYGDITDAGSLRGLPGDVEVVIHLASIVRSVSAQRKSYTDINVQGTINLFNEVIKSSKLKQFIYCSSEAVYGKVKDEHHPIDEGFRIRHKTLYGRTKYLGEREIVRLAKKNKLPFTIIRPSRIYGERDISFVSLCRLLKRGMFFNIGLKRRYMQPVYVTDCAEAIALSVGKKIAFGKTYNIAGENSVSKRRFISLIAKSLNVSAPRMTVPLPLMKCLAVFNELVCLPFHKEPFMSRRKLVFFESSHRYDISAVKRELKFRPNVDVERGVKKMIDWYKEEGLI